MKYIGNYSHWIKSQWCSEVLSQQGYAGTLDIDSVYNKTRYIEFKKFIDAGYSSTQKYWQRYTKDNVSFDVVKPPWMDTLSYDWWIIRMDPSNLQAMHADVDTDLKCNRFWIPLQDYEPGHVFIINDKLVAGYKAGDVFLFDNPTDLHGAVNLGFSPRLTLQIIEYLK